MEPNTSDIGTSDFDFFVSSFIKSDDVVAPEIVPGTGDPVAVFSGLEGFASGAPAGGLASTGVCEREEEGDAGDAEADGGGVVTPGRLAGSSFGFGGAGGLLK